MHNWTSFTKTVANKSIICYGAGVNASLMLQNELLRPFLDKILFFVDRNKSVQGTKIGFGQKQYDILAPTELDKIQSDHIVLVTISDYLSTGEMLDKMGIKWFPWTVISTDHSFSNLNELDGRSEPQYFLLNAPDYMNLGDHAITIAECNYLKSLVNDLHIFGTNVCHSAGMNMLKKHVKNSDVIFIQGGGNMGSLWKVCEDNIRNIITTFPDNKIIVFPQSVYYEDTMEGRQYFQSSLDIYNGHKDLLICTREKRSFDFVSSFYKCKCMLLPDMVLTLKNEFKISRNGIGVIIRDDKEKYIPNDYNEIVSAAINICGKDIKNITHHPVASPEDRERSINQILKLYSSCELIITDRLHGMILSAITDTPCIVFDNSYHKVSSVYNTWLADNDSITLAEPMPVEDLVHLIRKKTSEQYEKFNADTYLSALDQLTAYIGL